ncbi:MAG: hypothetical protein J0L80_02325 [Chitinophagales bacterium]|nr:hypothetical protein [Chitinophagales bacterium]
MEQDELTVDPHYLKGFNNGYELAKHQPDLMEKLLANPNEQNPYFKGLAGGKAEYDKEVREWANSFSKGSPAKDDRDIGKER